MKPLMEYFLEVKLYNARSLLSDEHRISHPPPVLAQATLPPCHILAAMSASSDKAVVLYTAGTPNGYVPTILLEELKVYHAFATRYRSNTYQRLLDYLRRPRI